jgi:hypothetical protein
MGKEGMHFGEGVAHSADEESDDDEVPVTKFGNLKMSPRPSDRQVRLFLGLFLSDPAYPLRFIFLSRCSMFIRVRMGVPIA